METIMNYLNTMFATVAQTAQMQKIKNDLAANMEEKYHELKAEGKSENEAVGTVIAEFGNIDELLKDIGLASQAVDVTNTATSNRHSATREEVESYLTAKKKHDKMVAIGVVIILIGVMVMLLLFGIFDQSQDFLGGWNNNFKAVIPIVFLLLTVVCAVSMFIIAGTQFEKYEYMENGVVLPADLYQEVSGRMEQNRSIYTMAITIGVALCIFGVVIFLILGALSERNEMLGVAGLISMLTLVTIACYLFICPGGMKETYEKLLNIGDFAPEKARSNKVIGVTASIVWPITVAAFLVWGLAFDGWEICWILFPAVGICFGGFAAACGALLEKN